MSTVPDLTVLIGLLLEGSVSADEAWLPRPR
jgi:hypothetical protein